MDAVRAHFRPEFLNRLDETIIFDRLAREDMDGIVDIQLAPAASGLPGARSGLSWIGRCQSGWPTKAMIRCSARAR